jgi:hypothetical protein
LLVTVCVAAAFAPFAQSASPDAAASTAAVAALGEYLRLDPGKRPPVAGQPFAAVSLTKADADAARQLLWDDHVRRVRADRAKEWADRIVHVGDSEMRFAFRVFGEKPAGGRSLYLSLHGGGGAPKRVNDSQWENQKRLYSPAEGVYLAPRAPTDTWDLWHLPPVGLLLERVIADAIVFEGVDPDRVYVTGYSAGGDGVYRLAPRLADRWAAAAMMAGHPGEISPRGLRNVPFAIHVGEKDGAYERNKRAAEWGKKLDDLRQQDPGGYEHEVVLHAGKGHWMDREDAAAIGWMARHRRNPTPTRVVWVQDYVPRPWQYWLAVPVGEARKGAEVTAEVAGQRVTVTADGPSALVVRLSDALLDLDRPMEVVVNGKPAFAGPAPRTVAVLAATLAEREDAKLAFPAEVRVDVPRAGK